MNDLSAVEDLTHDELRTDFPRALAIVECALDELRGELYATPESLSSLLSLFSSFDEQFRERLEGVLDMAVAAGEIEEYGSIESWEGGSCVGSKINVQGRVSGCGRGCCPPESRHVSIPLEWVGMPVEAFGALLKSRKEAKEAKEKARRVEEAQQEHEKNALARRATYERLRTEFEKGGGE